MESNTADLRSCERRSLWTRLFTREYAAEDIGQEVEQLDEAVANGLIRYIRVGDQCFVTEIELDHFADQYVPEDIHGD